MQIANCIQLIQTLNTCLSQTTSLKSYLSHAINPYIVNLRKKILHLAMALALYFQVWLKCVWQKISMSSNNVPTVRYHVWNWRQTKFRACFLILLFGIMHQRQVPLICLHFLCVIICLMDLSTTYKLSKFISGRSYWPILPLSE